MSTETAQLAPVTWDMRLRRAVPDSLVPLIVRARVRRMRRKPAVVAQAREEMEHLIGAARPDDVDRAAREYLYWHVWRSEMRYHPEVITRQDVAGLEHLTAAREEGRGALVAFLHHGQYEGAMASVARAGEPMVLLVDPMMLAPDAPKFLRQHVTSGTCTGCRPVSAAIGSAGIAELLQAGEVVGIALDVPSRSTVSFLGKQRTAASGLVRLATKLDAPVVPMRVWCDTGFPRVELLPAARPADFASPEEMLQHLLQLQEPAVLAWPEGYHQPLLRWGTPPSGG